MKTIAKLMAMCLMLASLGFAQGDTKKADDKKPAAPAAATDTKKDDGMAKPEKKKAKKAKKGKKADAAPAATPATK